MKLSKKAMEHPFPTPLYSRMPNEETTAWLEMRGGRGGNGNGPSREVPIMSGTAQFECDCRQTGTFAIHKHFVC